jgi:hypothetical protein
MLGNTLMLIGQLLKTTNEQGHFGPIWVNWMEPGIAHTGPVVTGQREQGGVW